MALFRLVPSDRTFEDLDGLRAATKADKVRSHIDPMASFQMTAELVEGSEAETSLVRALSGDLGLENGPTTGLNWEQVTTFLDIEERRSDEEIEAILEFLRETDSFVGEFDAVVDVIDADSRLLDPDDEELSDHEYMHFSLPSGEYVFQVS